MRYLNIYSIIIALLLFVTSCDNKEDEGQSDSATLNLSISGLEYLGTDYVYEGWLIIDGAPVTTGVFTVSSSGELSKTSFNLPSKNIDNATAFVLTIEPANDSDPAPSKVHILGGDISGAQATLSVGHMAALGCDFSSSTGKYILATPTNGAENDEYSGVWFLDPSSGTPGVGLNLPQLPEGWQYEGWAVIGGKPVTTGKFTSFDMADLCAPYSGELAGPPFPGEDFLKNAPDGLTFPTDLKGATIVVSVEPMPDNSEKPFLLKPLLGNVAANAMDHTPYDLGNISSQTNPTGSVSIIIK